MEVGTKRPRRLKWSCFETVPVPSKRSLGQVGFMDRWGNLYRWAPAWEEVWTLFLEMLRVEMSNNPEGPWAQVFRDLVGLTLARYERGEAHPEYPQIIEELMNMVYVGAYLDEHFRGAHVFKKLRLGPPDLHFKKLDEGNDRRGGRG